MLRITIELVPMGNEAKKKTLGVMHVANDGTGSPINGNYRVVEMQEDGPVIAWTTKGISRDPLIFNFLYNLLVKRKP